MLTGGPFEMIPDPARQEAARALFLAMIEASEPEVLLSQEPDALVRAYADQLWQHHLNAERFNFLDEPPELVRELYQQVASSHSWAPGTRLSARFVVLEFLGEGGMGEVYLAHDDRLRNRVALKTIRAELLNYPELRDRLVSEVHSARQVTHPNVCRIYDIYDDAGVSFFAMEYLPGETLSSIVEQHKLNQAQAAVVALQLAHALQAAHEKNILHRDFKPANVILTSIEPRPRAVVTDFGLARAFGEADIRNIHSLRGGTPDFMAPELLAGSPATVKSDIYAYGKVLALLLPRHRMIAKLTAEHPDQRPESMAAVADTLTSGGPVAKWTRRTWGIAAAAAAGGLFYWRGDEPHVPLGSRQRVIVNGLHGALKSSSLTAIYNLLQLALEQSPLLNVFPNQTLRAALRKRNLPPDLPAKIDHLLDVAVQEGARLIIDGEARPNGSGLLLNLDLYVDSKRRPEYRLSESVGDAKQLTRLAEIAALGLRKQCGESAGAIRNSYSPLERATSAIPEAVEYYFEAVQQYEQTHVEMAIALLDKALALDQQFALAHFYRGLALSASFHVRSGFESCERAFQLRDRTTPRERAWIESQYYNLTGDRLRALEAYKKNAFLFPDDAIFERQLGYGYARIGQFEEALKCSGRAVELDPFSVINRAEHIVNLAEAMRYDEALSEHQDYVAQNLGGTVPNWGAGLACLGKRRYADAVALFEELGNVAENTRWARQLITMAPILQGNLEDAAFQLEGDLAYDLAAGEEFRMLERQSWLAWTYYYRDNLGGALQSTKALCSMQGIPDFIFAWRTGGRVAAACGNKAMLYQAKAALRALVPHYPSTYLSASIAGMEADGAVASGDLSSAERWVIEALGLYPDPQNLTTAAHYFRAKGDFARELEQLRKLESSHGRILKHEWPGWIPVSWFEIARSLIDLGRTSEARPYASLVQQSWGRHLAGTRFGDAIQALSTHI
jgi:serine/threonine protein kinase